MPKSSEIVISTARTVLARPEVRRAASLGLETLDKLVDDPNFQADLRSKVTPVVGQLPPPLVRGLEASRASRRRAEKAEHYNNSGCVKLAARVADNTTDLILPFIPFAEDGKAVLEGSLTLFTAFASKQNVGWDLSLRRVDAIEGGISLLAGILPAPVIILHPLMRRARQIIEETTLPPDYPELIETSQFKAQALGMARALELPSGQSEEFLSVKRLRKVIASSEPSSSQRIVDLGLSLQEKSRLVPNENLVKSLRIANGLLVLAAVGLLAGQSVITYESTAEALAAIWNTPSIMAGAVNQSIYNSLVNSSIFNIHLDASPITQMVNHDLGSLGFKLNQMLLNMGKTTLTFGGALTTLVANPWRRISENSSVVGGFVGGKIEELGNDVQIVGKWLKKIKK